MRNILKFAVVGVLLATLSACVVLPAPYHGYGPGYGHYHHHDRDYRGGRW